MVVLRYYLSLTWFIHIAYRIHALTAILNSWEKQVTKMLNYLRLPACCSTSLDQTPRWKFRIQSVILSISILTDAIISWENSVQMGFSPMVLGTLSGKRKAKQWTGSSYSGDPFMFPSYFIVSLLGRLFWTCKSL